MDNKPAESSQPALSEAELQSYVAADAALTTTKPWELVITSKRMKLLAVIVAAITLLLHTFLAVVVDIGDTGTSITLIDQWGYFLVGVLFAVIFFIGLARPRVRVNSDGVDVRNYLGSRFYPWAVIYGLNFPEGSRMARLELPEFEYVPLWAIQSADGERCLQAVSDFRDLEARYMPED